MNVIRLVPASSQASSAEASQLRRLRGFYRALSDMNRASIHSKDPRALYKTICDIAVTSGGAAMAWVGLRDKDLIVPVAWSESAQRYVEGLEIRVPQAGGEQGCGPTALAFVRGAPYICNDYLGDDCTKPWRARADAFGVKSAAAFPIFRRGQAVGSLNLYFDQVGAFDDDQVALIEQMVEDLCFALENLDREEGRVCAERLAQERQLQLSSIVETALDAIITVNARFEVVVFNRAAAQMFGVAPQDAIGQSLDRFVPVEYRAGHHQRMAGFAAKGEVSRFMGRPRELQGQRANGEVFPMEASISRSGEGDGLLMTVTARDVTQLRQAERAQLASAAAEAANSAKTQFLSQISHELRTPLNAVLGFAQLMRADTRDPLAPRHQAQIDLVLQAGEHLRTLIDEMLDVSRIESGRMAIDARDFDLCALLRSVLSISQPQASRYKVRLEEAFSPACRFQLHTDPDRLRQVLLNLVSNAIKYNRPGGWVRLELVRDESFIHILVRDNGLGMTEQQKAQLFQPFNRLGRENTGVEGTGIGLVLVQQLVTLMGGDLAVDSEPDRGTCVRVTLPATDIRPSAYPLPGQGPTTAPAPSSHATHPVGTVLYIEDNPTNATIVEQVLTRWPEIRLVVAPDGASGLERARDLQPDVILLDMQLPDMAGLDVLRRLKADPATRDLVVIALSASAVAEDVATAREVGAVDYWTKPIDFERFLEGMRKVLPS
jgi:PAS domain S-box-containing protein